MKYVVYAGVAVLILWAVGYLVYRFRRQLKGKRGCDCGGCGGCPHTGCRHQKDGEV